MQTIRKQSFVTLIKPASSECNLRCDYCFYHSLAKSRNIRSYGMMRLDTAEAIVSCALSFASDSCSFAFQGGEPTLVGLDFFKAFVDLEKRFRRPGVRVFNAIQTNGTLLNREWAEFLAEHKFLVGISLDGEKAVHDSYRKDTKGAGTYLRVLESILLLDECGVDFNVLTVVNNRNVRHAQRLYNFFRNNRIRYVQFIPCLEPLEGAIWEYAPDPIEYGRFLITMFKLWRRGLDSSFPISIRTFDNLVQMAAGYSAESCELKGHCSNQFVIESDGSVYPCDFYVFDRWCLGNIRTSTIEELAENPLAIEFVNTSIAKNQRCIKCEWFKLCRGGCRRQKEPYDPENPAVDRLCEGYRMFFEECYQDICEVAQQVLGGL